MSRGSFPILGVEDLSAAVSFYERLGFAQTYAFPPGGQPAFVTVERDGAVLGIARRDRPAADRFSYWVYVDDVDGTFASLAAAGAPVDAAPRTEPWGERVARVRDPDGNIVHIGASAPSSQK